MHLTDEVSIDRHPCPRAQGTLFTPLDKTTSTQSLNVQLRKKLDLHVNLVHGFSMPGLKTRHENIDIVVIRRAPTAAAGTRYMFACAMHRQPR